jgi:hypothetical protein
MPNKTSAKKPTTGNGTRGTTDLQMPRKNDGTVDKRYNNPQFCKNEGSRDMRTTNTNNKK